MKKIIPVGNRVLIKVLKKTDDEFDLFVPERYATKPFRGKIIALGEPGLTDFKEGDIVLFKYFTGMQVYVEGDKESEYLILDVPHIIGKEVDNEKNTG